MNRKVTFSPASESATMRAWSQRVVDLVRRFSNSAPPINTTVLRTTPRALLHPLEPESEPETELVHMLAVGRSTQSTHSQYIINYLIFGLYFWGENRKGCRKRFWFLVLILIHVVAGVVIRGLSRLRGPAGPGFSPNRSLLITNYSLRNSPLLFSLPPLLFCKKGKFLAYP